MIDDLRQLHHHHRRTQQWRLGHLDCPTQYLSLFSHLPLPWLRFVHNSTSRITGKRYALSPVRFAVFPLSLQASTRCQSVHPLYSASTLKEDCSVTSIYSIRTSHAYQVWAVFFHQAVYSSQSLRVRRETECNNVYSQAAALGL